MQNLEFKKNAPKSFLWSVFLFVILIGIDQLVKSYATNVFKNFNFAFSLPVPVWLMYVVYVAVLIGMVYYCAKHHREFSLLSRLAWILIFAGAFSNIVERIFLGYVKDFIYITFYGLTGIYNLADGFIIAGIILLVFIKNKKSAI